MVSKADPAIWQPMPIAPMPMQYYDLQRNWRKVKRHIGHPDVQAVLVRDFNKFTFGRWRNEFVAGKVPRDFESSDWEWGMGLRGRHPAFWQYVKHSACHWLVNLALVLAMHVVPDRPWRIITSDKHSTVWDGEMTLFDFNFSAMEVPPDQCFQNAYEEELEPGAMIEVGFAEHFSVDVARTAKQRQEAVLRPLNMAS